MEVFCRLVKFNEILKEKGRGNIMKMLDYEHCDMLPSEYVKGGKICCIYLKPGNLKFYNSPELPEVQYKNDILHPCYNIPMKFSIGDKVVIKKNSAYIGEIGTIVRNYADGREFPFRVRFKDNYYSFKEDDIELYDVI